nr:hypothetical protein [Indioceanicola profundi]
MAEILSPTNTASEMNRKRAFYKEVAAIRDILEFEQDEAACTLLRHRGDVWVEERVAGTEALLRLDSIGVDIPLADIYHGIGLGREEEGA